MSVSTETTTLRQRREAIVLEHMDAENRHDVEATVATFHRPCYDVVPVNEMHDGSDSVRDPGMASSRRFPTGTASRDPCSMPTTLSSSKCG